MENVFREEIEIIPSELCDFTYCPRRWYLAYLERQKKEDNLFILDGTRVHEEVHKPSRKFDGEVMRYTSLLVASKELCVHGIADEVEFRKNDEGVIIDSIATFPLSITPVEHKRGKKKSDYSYVAQLGVVAMCLEEMYRCKIDIGILLFEETKEKVEILIDEKLRSFVKRKLEEIREARKNLVAYQAHFSRKCKGCSIEKVCDPRNSEVSNYLEEFWNMEDLL